MTRTAPTTRHGRLRLAVTAAVVLAALTVGTAGMAAPAPGGPPPS